MSPKYIALIVTLSAALVSCGGGAPAINATNCSGTGMQSALTTFESEAERQAFIDKCQALAEK